MKMKKKLLIQLYLFTLLFLTWKIVNDSVYINCAGTIGKPLPVFAELQIELLRSADVTTGSDALKNISATLLKHLVPEQAHLPWESSFLFLDLLPGEDQEVILAFSLPPDRGIVTILQKQQHQYILLTSLDHLLPISNLDKLVLQPNKELLVTRENHNEQMGAFSEAHLVKVWGWFDMGLRVLWDEKSYWELKWLNSWQDPKASPEKWYRLIQDYQITYQPTPSPSIRVQGTQSRYEAPADNAIIPGESAFALKKARQVEQVYYWNEKWQRFILHTALLNTPDSGEPRPAAILYDLEKQMESLVYNDPPAYQVIDQDGKVSQVDKRYLQIQP